ncbi:MAG: Hsp20/alpha crystallin family protein [Planctomycetota bacterium]
MSVQEKNDAAPTGATGVIEESRDMRELIAPRADIFETPQAVLVVADMPGVEADAVEVLLEKDQLTIRGRAAWEAPPEYKLAYEEFALGDYERTFRISDAIDRDRISASMVNGVLRLTLPKAAPAQAKRIAVTAE